MPPVTTPNDPQITVSSNGLRRGKLRLINRASIDGRTKAAQQFDAIATGISEDLGGSGRLSTVQRHLVEAFAGVALAVNDLNARLLLGEAIDIVDQSHAVSTMVRVAQRIGIRRTLRDVSPTLAEILQQSEEDEAEAEEQEP